ncbi:MAG: hypothetical protein ABF633_19605 [Clostridium sp.]|uniref:hypothetical protein n=1 Tax=Clostridium sp. TaxID=1506 RepID=UPI0039E983CC
MIYIRQGMIKVPPPIPNNPHHMKLYKCAVIILVKRRILRIEESSYGKNISQVEFTDL